MEDLAPAEQEAVSIGTIGTIGSTRKVGRPKKVKGKGRAAAAAAAALTAQSEMAAHFEVAAAVEDVPVFEPPATRFARCLVIQISCIPFDALRTTQSNICLFVPFTLLFESISETFKFSSY